MNLIHISSTFTGYVLKKIISAFIVRMRNMQIWLNDKTNCTHARTHPRRQSVKSDSIYSYPGIDQIPGSGPSELNLSWVEYKAINMTDDPVRQTGKHSAWQIEYEYKANAALSTSSICGDMHKFIRPIARPRGGDTQHYLHIPHNTHTQTQTQT